MTIPGNQGSVFFLIPFLIYQLFLDDFMFLLTKEELKSQNVISRTSGTDECLVLDVLKLHLIYKMNREDFIVPSNSQFSDLVFAQSA